MENNIYECGYESYVVNPTPGATTDTGIADYNQFLGDIDIHASIAGFIFDSRCNSNNPCTVGDEIINNNTYMNDVSVNSAVGIYGRGQQGTNISNSEVRTFVFFPK